MRTEVRLCRCTTREPTSSLVASGVSSSSLFLFGALMAVALRCRPAIAHRSKIVNGVDRASHLPTLHNGRMVNAARVCHHESAVVLAMRSRGVLASFSLHRTLPAERA